MINYILKFPVLITDIMIYPVSLTLAWIETTVVIQAMKHQERDLGVILTMRLSMSIVIFRLAQVHFVLKQ